VSAWSFSSRHAAPRPRTINPPHVDNPTLCRLLCAKASPSKCSVRVDRVRPVAASALVTSSGVTHRLNASGASVRDLDAVFISHLHVDHSADLVALLKMASFGSRQRSLALFGPHGSDRFPAIDDFVAAQIGPSGAYPYLGGFLTRGQPFVLDTRRVAGSQAELVFESGDDRVRAIAVAHGPVPALAYDVDLGGRRVAFMGDQRADDPRYVDMIRGADVLIAHMAIPERSPGVAAQLHAPPGRLGRVAEEAGVGAMVISHVMQRSLVNLDENLAAIREHYAGTLVVADDLDCFSLD
jgi:ribonuclease BN (tRNA processing enzyme)